MGLAIHSPHWQLVPKDGPAALATSRQAAARREGRRSCWLETRSRLWPTAGWHCYTLGRQPAARSLPQPTAGCTAILCEPLTGRRLPPDDVWYSYATRAASRLPVFLLAIPAKISGKGGWSNSESRRKSNTSAKSDYSIDNSRWIER